MLLLFAAQAEAAAAVRVAIPQDPLTLDPRYATKAWSVKISELIFEGLFTYDERYQIKPQLAQSYEMRSPTRYRFTLRPDARFHNGAPVTSGDVRATLESILDRRRHSPQRSGFEKIKAITTPDARTVEIELNEPYAPLLTSLTLGIVPAAEQEREDFGRHPTGSGLYRLAAWKTDEYLRLEPVARNSAAPPLEFRVLRDDTTRALAFIRGDLDLAQNVIPPLMVESVRSHRPGAKLTVQPASNFTYLGMRLDSGPLQKVAVRQAIAQAINREELLRYKQHGYGRLASGVFPEEHWAYEPQVRRYGFNPAAAKRLLDDAGYVDPDGDGSKKRFRLNFRCSTGRQTRELVRVIARDLENIGIGVNLRSTEESVFSRDLEQGNFDLFARTWTGVNEPDLLYFIFHSQNIPPRGANRGRYHNPRVDDLLTRAQQTQSPLLRRKLYGETQQLLAEDLPYIPLWHESTVVLTSPRVANYQTDASASFRGLARLTLNPSP